MNRRLFLRSGLAAGQTLLAAQVALLWPTCVLAEDWPADAFHATSYAQAAQLLFGGETVEESDRVRLAAKPIAENGATVPVGIETDLPGPLIVTFFSVKNPTPALARFRLTPELGGYLDTRIKMAATGNVVAVVTSGGRHYATRREIQVVAGGCG
jgi:sulfur-oxidizing protein SoxY